MNISDIKNLVGIIAVVLTFIGYIPYIKDTFAKKTTPHIYSWFLWGFLNMVIFGLQISDGAGAGAYVTLVAGLLCFVVLFGGLKQKTKQDITKSDTIFLILSFVAMLIWIVAKQPLLSALLATTIDAFGFAPTVRKSWNKPHSETLFFYFLNTFRFSLAIFALQNYTTITLLYPITWVLANGLFALMLVIRRKQLQ
jgi:hypothetical protein